MKVVTHVLIKIDWIEQGLDSSEGSLNGMNVHDRLNKWILFWSNPKLHSMEHSLTVFLDETSLEHEAKLRWEAFLKTQSIEKVEKLQRNWSFGIEDRKYW